MDIRADTAQAAPKTAQKEKKRARKKKKILRKIIWLVLILAVLGAAGYVGYMKLKQEYTITYQAYSATVGSISNSLSFSGTLQAVDSVTYTASAATTVRAVNVKKGDRVKTGDKLIRLANGAVIEAEFDGTVNQLYVAQGDKVVKEDSLIQIVNFDHMKVSIRVDEYDITDVKEGDAIRVTTTATEKTFDSTIDDINYVSSSTGSVAYYTATAYVDVTGGVYPGMQVTVTIPQEEASNVVILKEDALSFDATNQAYVYMQDEEGKLQETYVKTGVSNGNYVEITSGLKSGDTVYAEVKKTESSTTSLLASLFGGQQMMGGQNGRNQRTNTQRNTNWNGGSGMPNMPGGTGGGR